jgi:ribosomal protein S18 acetylase RimI-like enzyme
MLPAMVKLVPMTGAEFAEYLDTAVELYAQAHIKAGDCDASEALELARADYATLLPEGLATSEQYLYSIFDEASDARVGLIWLAMRERRGRKSAFIYDFVIREEHRGKGYGAQTLSHVDRMVKEMGAARIGLNVMGYNHAARALYEKNGYEITGIGMMKRLAPE